MAGDAAYERAMAQMYKCSNCAETVVQTVSEILNVPLPKEVLHSTRFFQEGMFGGCLCGALTGAVLVSGVLDALRPHPLGKKLPVRLHHRFKTEWGSACCRVIRSKRPLLERFTKKACAELTAWTAAMVVEEWADLFADELAALPEIERGNPR